MASTLSYRALAVYYLHLPFALAATWLAREVNEIVSSGNKIQMPWAAVCYMLWLPARGVQLSLYRLLLYLE